MQGLGGPDEDRRGGFVRGGWAPPLFYDEAATFLTEVYQRADAFLFGRRTYEIFAGSWGVIEDMRKSPMGAALNSKPKYVASTTLTDPKWSDTTVRLGCSQGSRAAYDKAIELAGNIAETAYLTRRRDQLG
jgi:dihydrofolate reductase